MQKITVTHELKFSDNVESIAYKVAPNVVVGRSPIDSREWQLLLLSDDNGPLRIQGGFRTRSGAVEAWKIVAEYVDGDVSSDPFDATSTLRKGVLTLRQKHYAADFWR